MQSHFLRRLIAAIEEVVIAIVPGLVLQVAKRMTEVVVFLVAAVQLLHRRRLLFLFIVLP